MLAALFASHVLRPRRSLIMRPYAVGASYCNLPSRIGVSGIVTRRLSDNKLDTLARAATVPFSSQAKQTFTNLTTYILLKLLLELLPPTQSESFYHYRGRNSHLLYKMPRQLEYTPPLRNLRNAALMLVFVLICYVSVRSLSSRWSDYNGEFVSRLAY